MSGGQLVVLDRLGREVKRFPLASGLATLGSDPQCDIRVTLPDVCRHHATVVVHANQTVVRNVGDGQTLVNGRAISVAALRHGDRVSVGGRDLRWDYDEPDKTRPLDPQPALYSASRRARSRARNSAGAPAAARSPALQLAIELQHRASMPGSAGGKQVAIVQPQRRDTTEQNDASLPRSTSQPKRRSNPEEAEGTEGRKSSPRHSPKALHSATKASMWIESRKSTPRATPRKTAKWGATATARSVASARKATPLRLAVLRRAASLSKVQPPRQLDQTKQVAIMLMTGHTPTSKLTLNQRRTPSFVAKKPSPGTRTTPRNNTSTRISTTRRTTGRTSVGESVSILEISDSTRQSSPGVRSRRSQASSIRSPLLPSPKKSAMKDPTAKKSSRKTESIKFDLSNLENHSHTDMANNSQNSVSEDDLTLHYDTSSVQSPSPRKSIHSRSSRMLEKTLGTTIEESPNRSTRSTLTPQTKSPSRKSSRGSIIMQKALESDKSSRYSSRTTKTLTDQSSDTTIASAYRTKTLSPRSPRNNLETYSIVDLVSMDSTESESQTSVYNSAGSASSSAFGTPHNSSGRKTRSTIDPVLVETSTPYVAKTKKSLTGSRSSPNISRTSSIKGNESQTSVRSVSSRRSKSQITPENTLKHITVDSTRISRGSRSRSRLSESDLLLISDNSYEDESPRSSKKSRVSKSSPQQRKSSNQSSPNVTQRSSRKSGDVTPNNSKQSSSNIQGRSSRKTGDVTPKNSNQSSPNIQSRSSRKTGDVTPYNSSQSSPNIQRRSSRKTEDVTTSNATQNEGMSTPENRHSPEEIGTPVLSIQSLLNSSQSSLASQNSHKKSRASINLKRKTIAAIRSEPKTRRTGLKSKSLNFTARRGLLRLSNDSSDKEENSGDKMVTPKSGVKLVQEAVKNKHSTAKKPQSKRSIIDNLDESADIVKQLFNSPVKRKLSQSMTEFSRKHLFDDEGIAHVKRPTRNTIALTGRTPENSILDQTEVFTPERFVSPIGTPASSPNLAGIKRILRKNTPDNDLTNVKGVKSLLRTPRTRKSVKNDLTNVSGVKKVFAKSPKNRLSDVRVKEVFAEGPKDDLRRVSGVKSLFQTQKKNKSPRNDLTDVRGVKKLFQRKSPVNDLTRVSGVKRTLRRHSPRNDLTDVRGVKRMYGEEKRKDDLTDVRGVKRMYGEEKRKDDLGDVSGVEELFNESTASKDTDLLFDRLLGRPPIRAKYSKSFVQKPAPKKTRKARSLRYSIDEITNNVEEWLEKELEKCLHKKSKKTNRELQNLTTDTVEGVAPVIDSRVRRSFVDNSERRSASEVYSAHKLPIKKRSLIDRQSTKVDLKSGRLSNNLPLKKRVLHSTPLKGRRPAAPALARVSPIPPVADHDTSISSDKQPKEPEPKSKRATKAKQTDPIPVSPKQTRTAKDITPKTRTTRNRQKSDTTQNNAKKSRPSLVIAKKSPVMSPKPTRTRRGKQEPVKETLEKKEKPTVKEKPKTQKKVKAQKDIPKVPTPKKTRGRKQFEEIVVPSPKKTRGRKQTEQKVDTPKASPKKTRTRKTEQEIPKESTPKRTRAKVQKNVVVVSKPSPKLKPEVATRRPRKTTASENNESIRDTKRRKLESPKAKPSKTEPKAVVTKTTRGRRNQAVESKPQETASNTSKSKTEARKTRTRNLQTQESTQSEPTSKRRKKEPENTVIPEVKSRKRKTTAEEVVPNKIAKNKPDSDQATRKTRGRKTADVEETTPKENTRQKRGTAKQNKTESEVAAPPARGRKTTVAAPAPKATRARKTEVKASPVKADGQQARSTRARAAAGESAKPTGRSRRR